MLERYALCVRHCACDREGPRRSSALSFVRPACLLQERQANTGRAVAAVVFRSALIVTRVYLHLNIIIVSVWLISRQYCVKGKHRLRGQRHLFESANCFICAGGEDKETLR